MTYSTSDAMKVIPASHTAWCSGAIFTMAERLARFANDRSVTLQQAYKMFMAGDVQGWYGKG